VLLTSCDELWTSPRNRHSRDSVIGTEPSAPTRSRPAGLERRLDRVSPQPIRAAGSGSATVPDRRPPVSSPISSSVGSSTPSACHRRMVWHQLRHSAPPARRRSSHPPRRRGRRRAAVPPL
jgi:hypothetical protein